MKRQILAAAAILWTIPAFAQQSSDISRVCTPILIRATVASVDKLEKTLFFRHLITYIYSRRTESLEKLENEGFELGVVVEGVPIKALWSKDESTKRNAENVYSKYVDETLLKNDFKQYKEVKDNSFASDAYNKCVSTMVSSSSPLICFYSPSTERDRTTLNVLFRPGFTISDNSIKTANIVNGFMLPSEDEMAKLPIKQKEAIEAALEVIGRGEKLSTTPRGVSTKLKIRNNKIETGVHSFDIFRINPDRETSVNLQWVNNLSCNVSSEPIARSNIATSIWPVGRDWIAGTDKFEYAATSGCGPGGAVRQEFCTATGSRVTSILPPHVWSLNCASGFRDVVMKPGSDNCVIATGIVGGCGFTQPWKTCKGRGWVKTSITVNKESASKEYNPERSSESYSSLEATWTKLFEYRGKVPDNFEADGWKFSVEINRFRSVGRETYVLTDSEPSQGDCTAKMDGDKRTGRVVISCGPQRSIPAGLMAGSN